MATITAAIMKAYGGTAGQIPASVLKSLPQDELLDRLSYAADLGSRSRTRDPVMAEGYALVAKAMLAAPPRAEIAQEIARRYLQAARTPDRGQAEALRQGASRLIEQNPPAPTRADVAKARAASRVPVRAGGTQPGTASPQRPVVKAAAKTGNAALVAVYDRAGNLHGVCDPADIIPAAEPKPKAATATPADVAKSVQRNSRPQAPPSAAVVKAAFRTATDPAEQNRIANDLQAAAIAGLDIIHGRQRR